ncbi:rhomboid family intramembrane serine protease GlpG [Alishewanella tabrizica]|uniref:Rhomboid protease GlpG n=1 Tax=Alishewanella tabrizica TaxID=671278 RepID=A0ABQ2WVH9_9ALTE|nr:rhomboid family intramembrane serine protease GlpG [Alishewanella tabrizica]GGW70421.1 rhomboid protease GlpG [Alishewanella tabrizica]
MTAQNLRKFVEFTSMSAAHLFADYCQTQGLTVQVQPQGHTTSLLAPAEQLEHIEPLLAEFLREPTHPRYQAAAWQQSHSVALPTGSRRFSLSALWQTPLTAALLLLTLAVYLWQQIDFNGANAALQLHQPAQVWRWITPILLHFSLTHLVFNLCWWVLLGQKIEQYSSSVNLLQLAVSSAVISNGLELALNGPNFGGLSGVVYALFGYCWLQDKLNNTEQYPVTNGLAAFMVLWLALGFMDVLWINMANWAHLGGLLCGLGWAWLSRRTRTNL